MSEATTDPVSEPSMQPDDPAPGQESSADGSGATAAHSRREARPARAGDLVTTWRVILGLAWLFAFFTYAAVWQASVQVGIGTWWVGPRAQPTSVLVKMVPFAVTLAVALCVIYNTPRIVRTSAVGSALAAVFAIPDFSRVTGLAVVELTIAVLLAVVTLFASTGRYRAAPVTDDRPGPTSPSADTTWIPPDPGAIRQSP